MLQLAPFVLLSLLLHVALLFFIRPPTANFSVAQQHVMRVYFSAPAVSEPERIPFQTRIQQHVHPARLLTSTKAREISIAALPDAISPIATRPTFGTQKLVESAKSMAREDARKSERDIESQEKKRLNTPFGSLEQYMRQPHDEIHLANGMVKIITGAGAICYQPAPYFAQDAAGVFGIPITCP
jgi:hypothetical protein